MIKYYLSVLIFAFVGIATAQTPPPARISGIALTTPDSTGDISNMSSRSTGSTTLRTLAARGADVVNVKDFGAVGNDTADDSSAINAAFAYVRALATPTGSALGSDPTAHVVFPGGTYKIAASGINVTGIRSLNVIIDMQGATIDCQVTGGICFDATGSQFLRFNGLSIVGSQFATPKIGVQVGRLAYESSDTLYFDRLVLTGNYSFAAYYNFASEMNTIVDPAIYNEYPGGTAYEVVLDGVNYWGASSAFQTITAPTNTAQSFTAVKFLGGAIMGTGTPLWICNLSFSAFDGTYFERGTTGSGAVIFSTPSWPVTEVSVTGHFETSPYLTDIFYINGPASTVNAQIRGFHYTDQYPEASNSLFKVSGNVAYVQLRDADIHIDAFQTPNAKVFDNPALWYVTGKYAENTSNHWNAPASFEGMTDLNGAINLYTDQFSTFTANGSYAVLSSTKPIWIQPGSGDITNILSDTYINGGLYTGHGRFSAVVSVSPTNAALSPLLLGTSGASGYPVESRGAFIDASGVRVSLGSSYTVPANTSLVRFTQSSTVDSSTITLPTAIADGQPIQFVNYGGAVTALTFSPAVNGWTNGATLAAYSGLRIRWDATAAAWYREQ
jgi:hypothetical protein